MIATSVLERMFAFSGLAIIGGSPRNPFAKSILGGLASIGYPGRVACINPNAEAVGDVQGYAALADVPFAVDAVAIIVRADRVPGIMEECGRAGVHGATIISAGFAEVGEVGRALQREVAAIAERYGIAVCGPNCLGFISFHDKTSTYSRSKLPARAGEVGFVSHSGGMLNEVISYGSYRGLGFSKVISAGNEAVVDLGEYLEHLVEDPPTKTIGLIVEGLRSPERIRAGFARAAEARKPIVAIKIGTSALAAASTATHTGAMAGSADLFAALCAQYGVTLVEDIDELCETLLALSKGRTLIEPGGAPRGTAAIEISGGGKGLVCDLADRYGLLLPPLQAPTVQRIAGVIQQDGTPTNPLDVIMTWESPKSLELHEQILDALLDDGSYDVVVSRVSVLPSGDLGATLDHGRLLARMQAEHPQTLFTVLGRASDPINPQWRALCDELGVPYFQGYKRGLAALAKLEHYRRYLATRLREPDATMPATIAAPPLPRADGFLDEAESKDVLAALGFPVNATRFAASVDEAVAAAEAIGYPVVIKGLSPHAVHKSDHGLVALGLRDARAVAQTGADVLRRVRALGEPADGRSGLSVQRQVEPGLEVIAGAYRDEIYGPVVMCALGGVFAEAFDERLLRLAPIGEDEAHRMLAASKVGKLAGGFRSYPAADLRPLAAILALLSRWVASDARVRELDLNPIVLRGESATIVDARILVRS